MMSQVLNSLGQPVGPSLPDWTQRAPLSDAPMTGRFCRLERFAPARHLDGLFAALSEDAAGAIWTYLPIGPYESAQAFGVALALLESRSGFQTFVILVDEVPVGTASYMRHDLASGCVEVGAVIFSPRLQRKPAATEAMYLMMARVFEAGYRRYEWKADALNAASCRAAVRLGFAAEGVWRQAMVNKGRNRDTAWFALIDRDWPAVKAGFEAWLAADNFDGAGQQRVRLETGGVG